MTQVTSPFGRSPDVAEIRDRDPAALQARDGRGVEQLAQEFEAMLLLQMVRQMRQALLEEERPGEGFGQQTMTETFDVEFARYLSQAGGIGLARALKEQLARLSAPATTGVAGAVDGVATPTAVDGRPGQPPAGTAAPGLGAGESSSGPRPLPPTALPLEGPVSSPFGWRTDPFLGTQKFHGGIDLQAAYGREVPAAASGRVVYAGEQGAYGHTVVVDHGEGWRTRYAHLSAIAVEPGQELAHGDVVGRVGQSGRATGPHLHFEVWKDGARVDPVVLARAKDGALKASGPGVDFPFDGVPGGTASDGVDHED